MNKLGIDYGSSSDDEDQDAKNTINSNSTKKVQIFIPPKLEADNGGSSTLKKELKSIFDILPKPASKPLEASSNSDSLKMFLPKSVADKINKEKPVFASVVVPVVAPVVVPVVDTVDCAPSKHVTLTEQQDMKEEEEEFDFFSLEQPTTSTPTSTNIPSKSTIIGPSRIPQQEVTADPKSTPQRAPFVFKPVVLVKSKDPSTSEKAVESSYHGLGKREESLLDKDGIQIISHGDLLGSERDRKRRKEMNESRQRDMSLLDDPFEKLGGGYVASHASTRTNSIMQMAHQARLEYAARVEQKAERKHAKKQTRAKYGF